MKQMRKIGRNIISWSMLPTILTLAWPTMLEEIMQTAVQYVDTAMVGVLGTHATAAVGATTTINWLINGTLSAMGVGFLTFIARALGAQDRERARRIAAQTVCVVLAAGIFFTVLTLSLSKMVPVWMQVDPVIRDQAATYFFILYVPTLPRAATIIFGTALRSAGDSKTPMRIGMLVNGMNIVLNFLLIYPSRTIRLASLAFLMPGAGMGISGAALASAIAVTAGGVCSAIAFCRHPVLAPRKAFLRPDWGLLRPCLQVALPNMLQRFAASFGYVVFAAMINALGEVSAAAHTIANTAESAFYIPGYGMQAAASTLAGNALGKGDRRMMNELTRTIIVVEGALMVLSGGLLLIFAPTMVGLFSSSPSVIALGSIVLRMVAVSEPFFGISIIVEGILLGVGDTVRPFLYNMIGMWGIRIVGTFLCTRIFGLGLIAAWGCMILHNLILFTLHLIYCVKGKNSPLNGRIRPEIREVNK